MLKLRVYGEPKPQPRPRVFARAGRAVAWSPESDWRKGVFSLAYLNRPPKPLEQAVCLNLAFVMPRRSSTRKRDTWHTKRPDADNLAKAVIDALVDAHWIKDDGLVASLIVEKIYATKEQKPGVFIQLGLLS